MEQEFILKSFKIDGFEVESKYRMVETSDDGETLDNSFHVHCGRPIHEDLQKLFEDDLTQIVRDMFGDDAVKHITTTGIEIAGKGENIGLRIFGVIGTRHGDIRFRTPRIKYLVGQTDVCAKMTVFVDKMVNEAHAYLFEGKSADLSVFGE